MGGDYQMAEDCPTVGAISSRLSGIARRLLPFRICLQVLSDSGVMERLSLLNASPRVPLFDESLALALDEGDDSLVDTLTCKLLLLLLSTSL